ncbi:FkbM family methyltransferase [Atlantibacter sp.]|uniref:FkbM family methyltransferase n=1 Tax=Atlantibacter sp. TaxID=1903473 RepID=UPI00289DCC23|nr:FkbM family methyltransferase [Atlantibacter sp.]
MNIEKIQQLCDNVIKGHAPCYVFGTTLYAADIAKYINVEGFIDDFTSQTIFHNKPVINRDVVPTNAIVISGIVEGRPLTANKILKNSGFSYIDYFSFKRCSGFPLRRPAHGLPIDFKENYNAHKSKYENTFSLLSDEISKETFSRLVDFRLHENLSTMDFFTFRPGDIYFEDFLNLPDTGAVFVDVGCFDGETTCEFIRRYPFYSCVHLFEPEPTQMETIKRKLDSEENIHFYQYGVSNSKQNLRFTSSGLWSHLDESGEIVVEVDKIDNLITGKTDFIKMDVEGHEYAALEGARQHIINHHPALAICAYHLVDDFWKLPELVLSIRNDYKLYMRHYTEGVLETVYYFIPQKERR